MAKDEAAVKLGTLGGQSTLARYGPEHYAELGRKGKNKPGRPVDPNSARQQRLERQKSTKSNQ